MSNIIPPLLSNSPPPPPSPEEDEEDEFGDFTVANDLSYGCDGFSPLPSPDLSSDERSPFKILNAPNHILEKNKEAENSVIDDQEKKISNCDCSKEINSLCSDNFSENNEILSDKICESVEVIQVDGILSFPNCDSKHSISNELDTKENDRFKINNNEDLFEKFDLTHKRIIEISHISDEAKISTDSDPVHSEDNSSPSNCLEPRTSLDENFETSKNIWDLDENSVSFLQNQLQENLVRDISADLEIDNIFSKSVFVDSNYEGTDSTQDAYVSDNCIIEKDSLAKISEPSSYDYLSNLHDESNCEEFIEKTYEQSLKSIDIDKVEVEYGEFTDFRSKVEELPALKSDTTKKHFEIFKSSEENQKSSEFDVKDDLAVADDFSWHSLQNNPPQVVPEADFESDDEFADFASHQVNPEPSEKISLPVSDKQDDFEDFGEFTSTVCDITPATSFLNQEDDFQSFADFSKIPESVCLLLDEKEAFNKAEQILKEMFPALEDVIEDFDYFELAEDDFIFKQLQDVTDTPALTYQWSKSAGQKALLKSLNIDSRNILYGPSWNPSMPRFAANLGLQPLEPIKTEHPTSSVLKPIPSTSQAQNVDIPSAQFDWTGSGLVNPLDYSQTTLLDLEQLVASLDIPTSINMTHPKKISLSPSIELDDWEKWLKSLPKDTASPLPDHRGLSELPTKKSPSTIFEHSDPTPENASATQLDQDDFEDFTSYQSPEIPQIPEWTNALPLRETYISNTTLETVSGPSIEAWLQPTIVTPELPRKTMVEAVDEETSSKVMTTYDIAKENDDEFTEFQGSSTEHSVPDRTVVGDSSSQKAAYDFLSDFDSIKTEGVVSGMTPSGTQPDFTSFNQNQVDCVVETKSVIENGPLQAEEDEFTDFQSSKPQTTNPVLFCAPIMEPLKPVPVYSNNTPTQINWPDPGINDEDIKKFEEVFSRPAPPKQEEPVKPPVAIAEKQRSSLDDEEWTEFVSVQKPSPVHKLRTNDRERTSSPDLPLSVFNLGNIQPMKQPIPVITPHGLVQTKLSASSVNSSPKTHARNSVNSRPPFLAAHQPSIISEQYISQAYNFSAASNHNSVGQKNSNNWSFASQVAPDEDEWGEFVSSPLPPQQNGHLPSATGWSSAGTNIITNPRHYGGGVSSRVSNKGAVSNMVLPELDFVAPKGRTATSRKK